MKQIFVNLKRFDIPKSLGGICALDNPEKWIEGVMKESVEYGLGKLKDVEVTFLLPEALIISAAKVVGSYDVVETESIKLGCQGVFRENVAVGGNFGAFTTNRPAAAMKSIGCTCSIIGHSEERKDKFGIIAKYDPSTIDNLEAGNKARAVVSSMINEEAIKALDSDMKVLVCVGETAEEKGDGDFEQQKPRIEAVLKAQLELSLKGVETRNPQSNVVIGYEPIWAIGPGKTPPGAEYIAFVSTYIKKAVKEMFGFYPLVVYGGGLKEENVRMISMIESIDGGLVALTKFSGEIGFFPEDLKKIIENYVR